jgi:hypothetical protein
MKHAHSSDCHKIQCNLNFILSFKYNRIFYFKKKNSHPIKGDHTEDTNTMFFFWHFIDISIGSSLSQNFMLKLYIHTHKLFPMGKANEPSKVENWTTEWCGCVVMLDGVNKSLSFLKNKKLTIVSRYCTPCPKVGKPPIPTLGLKWLKHI